MKEAEYWKCSRRSCHWIGTQDQKVGRPDSIVGIAAFTLTVLTMVCPICGRDSFYRAKPCEIERAKAIKAYHVT